MDVNSNRLNNYNQITNDSILNIKMYLSAYGVESDDYPNINAYIDFKKDSSFCHKWFFNPKNLPSNYVLNKKEVEQVLSILQKTNLKKLKKEYRVEWTDQPTSTLIIQTHKRKYIIQDYGLEAEASLKKLYEIVYKL